MLRKVLVCLDGSALGEKVLSWVKRECARSESRVTMFHILTTDIPMYALPNTEPMRYIPFELFDEEVDAREARMRLYLEEISAALRARGLDADFALVKGRTADLGEDIAAYAVKDDYSLIAMATHGYKGWRRLLWGSVTESVTRLSSVPVLVIRPAIPGRSGNALAGVTEDFTLSSDGA